MESLTDAERLGKRSLLPRTRAWLLRHLRARRGASPAEGARGWKHRSGDSSRRPITRRKQNRDAGGGSVCNPQPSPVWSASCRVVGGVLGRLVRPCGRRRHRLRKGSSAEQGRRAAPTGWQDAGRVGLRQWQPGSSRDSHHRHLLTLELQVKFRLQASCVQGGPKCRLRRARRSAFSRESVPRTAAWSAFRAGGSGRVNSACTRPIGSG